jgi:hypothetical protein
MNQVIENLFPKLHILFSNCILLETRSNSIDQNNVDNQEPTFTLKPIQITTTNDDRLLSFTTKKFRLTLLSFFRY